MDIEKENTFRALKDERPIATRQIRCNIFGWHTWTLYAKPITKQEGVWDVTIQLRECACCGLINRRVLSRS